MEQKTGGSTSHLFFVELDSLCLLSDFDAGEAHERHGEEAGGNEGDGHAAHGFRHVGQFELFADAGKDDQCEGETDGRRDTVGDGFQ